jgi:hypothetical protein
MEVATLKSYQFTNQRLNVITTRQSKDEKESPNTIKKQGHAESEF